MLGYLPAIGGLISQPPSVLLETTDPFTVPIRERVIDDRMSWIDSKSFDVGVKLGVLLLHGSLGGLGDPKTKDPMTDRGTDEITEYSTTQGRETVNVWGFDAHDEISGSSLDGGKVTNTEDQTEGRRWDGGKESVSTLPLPQGEILGPGDGAWDWIRGLGVD